MAWQETANLFHPGEDAEESRTNSLENRKKCKEDFARMFKVKIFIGKVEHYSRLDTRVVRSSMAHFLRHQTCYHLNTRPAKRCQVYTARILHIAKRDGRNSTTA